MKLTKQEQKEHADLFKELTAANAKVADAFEALLDSLRSAPEALNGELTTRNKIVTRINEFVTNVHDRLEGEFDDKSERWQEGEAGQAAQGLIEAWGNVEMAEAEEVEIVEPELEDVDADDFENLPHEPA